MATKGGSYWNYKSRTLNWIKQHDKARVLMHWKLGSKGQDKFMTRNTTKWLWSEWDTWFHDLRGDEVEGREFISEFLMEGEGHWKWAGQGIAKFRALDLFSHVDAQAMITHRKNRKEKQRQGQGLRPQNAAQSWLQRIPFIPDPCPQDKSSKHPQLWLERLPKWCKMRQELLPWSEPSIMWLILKLCEWLKSKKKLICLERWW